jgi:hypothetical protein
MGCGMLPACSAPLFIFERPIWAFSFQSFAVLLPAIIIAIALAVVPVVRLRWASE